MSHESRDVKKPDEPDDEIRSHRAANEDDQNEAESQDDSDDSGRSSRKDHEHRREHDHRSDADSRAAHEHHSHAESRDHADRTSSDDADADAEVPRHHSSDRSAITPPHSHHAHDRSHGRHQDQSDDQDRDRVADYTKFASYGDDTDDDDAESSRSDSSDYSEERRAGRTYRPEPAHRRHDSLRAAMPREVAAVPGPVVQQTVAPWRATDTAPYSAAEPSALTDPSLAFSGAGLHPYDHHRASLIGLSTALVTAIIAIVALMINLSTHKDLAQSALKDRKSFEDRLILAQGKVTDAEALAAQHARAATLAADQVAQHQRLIQTKDQAYQAAQNELRRQQTAQQQAQGETQRRLYVTQIRLAKQAWDRGDTNEVLRLLEPYRADQAMQKLCSFAWYYLWRAAHSGGNSVLRGHTDVVRQALVTPDGTQIITFADDGQLIVWDAVLGRKLSTVALERNVPPRSSGLIVEDQLARRASGLAIANNGAWAASYGRNLYVGANIRQPGAVRPVSDHQSPIISLAISPDGKRLVSGDYTGEIIVRDASDGRALRRFHNPRPLSLLLSNDGSILFAGMHDGGLFVWDTTKDKDIPLGTRNFGDGINAMAVSPDGSTLALALAVRDGVVRLWEPGTGRFHGDLRGHHDEVLRVAWSRDGKSLLTASRDQTACLWSTTGGLLRTFRGHLGDVETAAFTPDGQKVVTAGDDQSAILWNVDGGQPCDMLPDTPVDGWVSGLAFTPAGNEVIGTGSCDEAGGSFEAFLTAWNLADSNRPEPLQTSSRAGVAIAFSPDGRQMAVGESSPPQSTVKSRVRIWSLDPPRVLGTAGKLAGSVYSVAYSNDGRLMAVGTGDVDEIVPGRVQILEPSTGALRQTLPDMPGKVESAFSGGSLITVNSSKKRPAEIHIWNASTLAPTGQIVNPRELDGLTAFALSPDGRHLVTGHGDPLNPAAADKAKIKVWDLSTGQLAGTFPAAHPAAITRLEFSRRGLLLASGDMAGNVRLWDFAAKKLFAKQVPPQGKPIVHLAFDLLGERLAVAADETCVRVWQIDTGKPLAVLELALGVANVVRYTQDGKRLAAATSAGGLFLWDSDTYRPRAILRGEGNPGGQQGHGGVITCVAPWLSDKLLTGSVDKTVRIWDLKTRKAVAVAFPPFKQAVSCMAVSPDGHTLAVGTGKYRSKFETGELVLCPLDNRQSPKSISQGITPVSLAYSPDGNTLAVCSASPAVGPEAVRAVNLIDLRTGHPTPIASPMGHSVAFSPDGRILAVGCTNGEIDLWALDTPGTQKPFVVKKHQALVWSLAFSPDGKTLASGSMDNNVVIWDVPTGEDLMTLKHNGMVEALQFSSDGRILASASHEPSRGSVCLWRAPADEEAPQNTLRSPDGPSVSNRAAGLDSTTAMRSTYSTPSAAPASQPMQSDRRMVNPAAPISSTYSQSDGDRYNTAPSAGLQPAPGPAGIDPAVPLQTGGSQSLGSGPQPAEGFTPPGGFSQPSDAQGGSGAARPNTGRRTRAGL